MSHRQLVIQSVLKRARRLEVPSALHNNIVESLPVRQFSDFSRFSDKASFEEVCDETLDSLTEYFEELIESVDHLEKADVNYSDGVLTVQFGEPYGTYVINRQSPNQQIWLSSPTSGPKRYDFLNGVWIYRHDGVCLHQLLNQEISKIVRKEINFKQCSHSNPLKQ